MAVALMDKAAGQAKLPETPAVVALFAFGSRLDRDTMQLFARTHSEEVRAAAIASTGQEVLELLLIAAYTKAMGWSLAVGPGPGTELRFTLPPAPPLDDLMLESPVERMAEQQTRRLALRRELAVLQAQELL